MIETMQENSKITVRSPRGSSALVYLNPLAMAGNLWNHRQLIFQFSRREVQRRYKGSYLGMFWSFINPLFMLTIYTFVFSVILKARWGTPISDSSQAGFALTLFAGLIMFNVLSECMNNAPGLIINNPHYVKKVIFPLEILPVSILGASLVHSLVNLAVFSLGLLILNVDISLTFFCFPFIFIPLIFLCLGVSWFLASLGVFVRDIGQLIAIIVQMLFFATPLFYPITAIPDKIRFIFYLNPMTFIVEHFRQVTLWQQLPNVKEFLILTAITLVISIAGYWWFMRSKQAFADVL